MSGKTGIEWTDSTWNPVVGCSAVSPGCAHCYAERMAHRLHHLPEYEGLTVLRDSGPRWTGEVRCLPERLEEPLRRRKPTMYFVNSMSDLFHEDVPDDFILSVMNTIRAAHENGHTFQVLTKRAERMRDFISRLQFDNAGSGRMYLQDKGLNRQGLPISFAPVMRQLWLGFSAEDQKRFDERWAAFKGTPAAVVMVSLEPLLGPIVLPGDFLELGSRAWVIAGGESGPGARPMHPNWARDIRDQCTAAKVPFFFKQWGEWEALNEPSDCPQIVTGNKKRLRVIGIDGNIGRTENPTYVLVARVGKRAAGRLLDGVEHNEFPEAP